MPPGDLEGPAPPRGVLHRLSCSARPEQRVDMVESVVENLRALLNSDRGSSVSSPEFGISLHDVLSRWSVDKRAILVDIAERIERFEPRLKDVTVHALSESDVLRFNVLVEGTLPTGRPFRVRTQMAQGGSSKVELLTEE